MFQATTARPGSYPANEERREASHECAKGIFVPGVKVCDERVRSQSKSLAWHVLVTACRVIAPGYGQSSSEGRQQNRRWNDNALSMSGPGEVDEPVLNSEGFFRNSNLPWERGRREQIGGTPGSAGGLPYARAPLRIRPPPLLEPLRAT